MSQRTCSTKASNEHKLTHGRWRWVTPHVHLLKRFNVSPIKHQAAGALTIAQKLQKRSSGSSDNAIGAGPSPGSTKTVAAPAEHRAADTAQPPTPTAQQIRPVSQTSTLRRASHSPPSDAEAAKHRPACLALPVRGVTSTTNFEE